MKALALLLLASMAPAHEALMKDVRAAAAFVREDAAGVRKDAGNVRVEFSDDVTGVCLASASTRTIRCSADALTALTAPDRKAGRASAALLYVIAHELAHLDQKDAGDFEGPVLLIDLGHAEQAKWNRLRRVCEDPSDRLRYEEAADAAALTVLERAAESKLYREPLLSPRAAVYTIADRMRLAANALKEHEGPARERPKALEDAEDIARTARALLCEIRQRKRGIIELPNVPGTHPAEATRIAAISQLLRDRAKELPAKNDLPPEMPDLQPVDTLIGQMGDITAVLERQEKELYEALWPHVCETWLNPGKWPDCTD